MAMNPIVDSIAAGNDLTFNLEFQRDEESGWFAVHVVELPGCVSQGVTVEEAKANIADALESYLEVLLKTAIQNQAHEGLAVEGSPADDTARLLVRPNFEVRA